MAARLLPEPEVAAAQKVLERLTARVPGWLERTPISGEAGYIAAADAVLKVMVDAEDDGRSSLSGTEIAHRVGAAKPAGVTVDDVLKRMKRDKLIRVSVADGRGKCWVSAAPAGRRQLGAKDGLAHASDWHVDDALGLLELIYREHRPGREGFRPWVQAIGGLGDARFNALVDELRASGLLEPVTADERRLFLTDRGARLAEDRLRPTMPGMGSCGTCRLRPSRTTARSGSEPTDATASAPAGTATQRGCGRAVRPSVTRRSGEPVAPSGTARGAGTGGSSCSSLTTATGRPRTQIRLKASVCDRPGGRDRARYSLPWPRKSRPRLIATVEMLDPVDITERLIAGTRVVIKANR